MTAVPKVVEHWSKPNNTMSLHPIEKAVPGDTQSRNSGGTAGVLPAERSKATFDVEKMTNFIDGGKEKTKRRRFILSPGIKIGTLVDKPNWERPQMMREHVKDFIAMHDPYFGTFVPTREEVTWMSQNTMNTGSMMNHFGLFLPTITAQASDKQMNKWAPKAFTMKIVGAYAQTELGHGSNVRGLQTTAHFDKSTQEFVLNTPTLQSMKWWPGTLGKIATHALVYAQLILDKEYGVHIFMVQLRDENHRPLPGIELGDLGKKFGDHANDTGFLRLDNVRVPRDNMLAKFQSVTPEGVYEKSKKKNEPQTPLRDHDVRARDHGPLRRRKPRTCGDDRGEVQLREETGFRRYFGRCLVQVGREGDHRSSGPEV